jgi:hypothetical protein
MILKRTGVIREHDMALPLFLARKAVMGGLRGIGATLFKKFLKGKGKEIKGKAKKALLKKLKKQQDKRKPSKAPNKKPQSDKDILSRINRDRLKEEGIVVPKHLKKAYGGGGRAKKIKKEREK